MQYPGVSLEIKDSNFDLKEAPIKDSLNFIRKVYGIVSVQLLVTAIVSAIVMLNPALSEFVQENLVFFFISLFCAIVVYILLLCFKRISHAVPTNYFVLFIFTLCESYMVATSCSLCDPSTVIIAAVMTLGVTLTLTAYSCIAKFDFEPMQGCMLVGISSIVMMVFFLFYLGGFVEVICCTLCVIIYGGYLIIDVELILESQVYELSSDDYIIGSILIYLDVIVLFIRIMEIIEKFKK